MVKQTDWKAKVPLFISRSSVTTASNKTGTWRFVRPFHDEKTAPCSSSCPVGEDIPRIEYLLANGRIREAWNLILLENPLPSVCGRVCYHPCESVCNRALIDSTVGVHAMERYIGDCAIERGWKVDVPSKQNNGKKIAVVGSGPAGLAAAWFLTMLGYTCEIMEKKSKAGGLLRWGIPAYRLPENVLQKEIGRIEHSGVRIVTGRLVTAQTLNDLKRRFDAVFVGAGNERSFQMKIPGEELAEDGLAFLRKIREGKPPGAVGKSAVIGGGNTAVDVARSLVRMGADPVIVYRRRKEDMPAAGSELEAAAAEGVEIMELAAPERITLENGGLNLHLLEMQPEGQTGSPRSGVVPSGRKKTIRVKSVFTAIGAGMDKIWDRSDKDNGSRIDLDHVRLCGRDVPVVYGGDLVNTGRTVTDALASGKQAAIVLDTFFSKGFAAVSASIDRCRVGGEASLSMEIYLKMPRAKRNSHQVRFAELNTDYFQTEAPREENRLRPVSSPADFGEVNQTVSPAGATAEASRCCNCGICNDCDNCRLFCPELAVSAGPDRKIDLTYCKGCGICAVECSRNALSLEEEAP